MNQWRLVFAGMTLGTLCACAAPQGTATPTTSPVIAKSPAVQITDLPCAEVSSTDPMTIRYPADNLYRMGAVLPKEAGLTCLETLADWLKSRPQNPWQITLSGEDGLGFDPLELAGKRQELLQRFFTRKGVEMKNWEWQTMVGQGEQMQMRQLKDSL